MKRLIQALKCQAVQDQIGNKYEFQEKPLKENVINDYRSSEKFKITDDTQMTLFLLEGLFSSRKFNIETIKNQYKKFLITQLYDFEVVEDIKDIEVLDPLFSGIEYSGLITQEKMFSRQQPGCNTLNSIANDYMGKNDSKGCGTVMRGLPYCVFETQEEYLQDQALTHHHPEIQEVTIEHHTYLRELHLGNTPPKMNKTFQEVYGDGGWTARPCFEIARFQFENCNGDFEELLNLSICHQGDSDSTAQVQGQMFGLQHPDYDIDVGKCFEADIINTMVNKLVLEFQIC